MTNLFDSSELPEQHKPFPLIVALSENDFRPAEDHVPRIVDWRLAQVLGFGRPERIRELIVRNRKRLEQRGTLPHRAVKSTGGRPATEYLLNFRQSLLIVLKSETANAEAVQDHILDIYEMWHSREVAARDAEVEVKVADSVASACETAPALMKVLGLSGQEHPFGYDPEDDDRPIIQGHDSAA
jgi:hypothetical protein